MIIEFEGVYLACSPLSIMHTAKIRPGGTFLSRRTEDSAWELLTCRSVVYGSCQDTHGEIPCKCAAGSHPSHILAKEAPVYFDADRSFEMLEIIDPKAPIEQVVGPHREPVVLERGKINCGSCLHQLPGTRCRHIMDILVEDNSIPYRIRITDGHPYRIRITDGHPFAGQVFLCNLGDGFQHENTFVRTGDYCSRRAPFVHLAREWLQYSDMWTPVGFSESVT